MHHITRWEYCIQDFLFEIRMNVVDLQPWYSRTLCLRVQKVMHLSGSINSIDRLHPDVPYFFRFLFCKGLPILCSIDYLFIGLQVISNTLSVVCGSVRCVRLYCIRPNRRLNLMIIDCTLDGICPYSKEDVIITYYA